MYLNYQLCNPASVAEILSTLIFNVSASIFLQVEGSNPDAAVYVSNKF